MGSFRRIPFTYSIKQLQTNTKLRSLKVIVRYITDRPSRGLKPIRPPSIPTVLPSLESNSTKCRGLINEEFHSEKVQKILRNVTGMNLDKVFSRRKGPQKVPTYQLMTEEELNETEAKIKEKATRYLEMPQVMGRRKPLNITLSEDPEIDGFDEDNAKFVFVDITANKSYQDRRIVVREPNGILREATWPERDTLEMIYFPRNGLRMWIPAFLRDKHLPVMFEQKRHAFVLDFVNLQCAPDSEDYWRVHERTYEDIENCRSYHLLHSTRHYGGLVYYLLKNRKIEGLITDTLEQERLEDAVDLVRLYYILHSPEGANAEIDGEAVDILRTFLMEQEMNRALSLLADLTLKEKQSVL